MVRQAASPRRLPYVLGVLFLVNAFNLIDRQIINILAEPIKNDLNLADWQLGLMSGLAFAVVYTVLAVPLARIADRANRVRLISVCLAFWSMMTSLCALASSFAQLVAARMGVAVGEAGCHPAAHSLICDYVPREKRASALAVYSAGIPAGKLVGLMVGGMLAEAYGWRWALLLVGAPGLLLAVVVWFSLPDARPTHATRQDSLWAVIRTLIPRKTFWHVSFAAGFLAFLAYGQTAFLGSFLIRTHGISVGEAGAILGVTLGVAGLVGAWLGGWAADLGARWDARAYMWAPAIASLAGGALSIGAVLAETLPTTIALLTLAGIFLGSWYGPVFATVQTITVPQHRATVASIHLFILNLVGIGGGPLLFGALSDLLNSGFNAGLFSVNPLGPAEGLRWALAVGSTASVLAAILLWHASRSIREDSEKSVRGELRLGDHDEQHAKI